MKIEYTLTPRLRLFFKEPFGDLISGTPTQTMQALKELAAKEKPPMIITVGDVVTQNLHEANFAPQLSVVDFKSLRDQQMPKHAEVDRTVHVANPMGTITTQAQAAIKEAIEGGVHTHIEVEGEEDLLTLPALLYAPEGSFVVYGQPHVGIVVAKASKNRKEQVKELLKEMKPSKS